MRYEENQVLPDWIRKMPRAGAFGFSLRQAGGKNHLGSKITSRNNPCSYKLFQKTYQYQ